MRKLNKLVVLIAVGVGMVELAFGAGPTVTTARNLTPLAFCASGNGTINKTYRFFGAAPGTNDYRITWSAQGLPAGATLAADGTLTMPVSDADVGKTFGGITVSFNDGVQTQSKAITISIRSAKTYYVAKNGSDSNPGTSAAPWVTMSKAAMNVLPGDTVLVDKGVYLERITTRGLTNGPDYTTFKTAGAEPVECLGFALKNDYTAVDGFNITNTVSAGVNLPGVQIAANYARVVNNYIYNQRGRAYGIGGYWYDRPQLAYIANNHIYRCQNGIYTFGMNWTIESNEIERLCQWDAAGDSDYVNLFGEGHLIRNNYLHGTIQSEVPSAHVDAFQTYDDANSQYWCANVTIERNFCSEFHEGFMAEARWLLKSHDIVLKNNLFHNGLPLDSTHPLGVKGVIVHDIPNMVVANNTFYNITYGLTWTDTTYGAATNALVINNLMVNTGYGYEFVTKAGNVGDYNLVYPGKPSYAVGPNDLYGVNPEFINVNDPIGPDGVLGTADDGFNLKPGSRALTSGKDGAPMGAYTSGSARPAPPAQPRVDLVVQ